MINHKKQITIGAILSYVYIALGAIITLLYTPFMIRTLGQSEYGLYNTVSSVISSLSILSLGFGSSYVRFFSKYKANEDKQGIAKLNGMFMTIFLVIGIVALASGLFLSNNLRLVFDNGLSAEELSKAKILMTLLSINLAISFPASVFTSIITANEEFIFQKVLILIKQVICPLVCIPLLLMGYASVGLVLSTVCISLVVDAANVVFCVKKLNVKFIFHDYPKNVFKDLAIYSGFIALNMIVDQINLNIDKFLLGRFCGTSSVAVYSAGFTLYNYYHSFSTSISNVFTPRVHHIWSDVKLSIEEKNIKLSELFGNIGRIQFVILWLVCSGLIIFGKQFIRVWAGPDYGNAYYVVLLLSISAIVPLSQNLGIEIQRAKNMHQFRAILYAVMAVINLVLSIYLCQIYGEIGSAFGTAVSFIIANTVIMNIFYSKALDINVSLYWKCCFRVFVSTLPAIVIALILCGIMDTYRLVYMLYAIIIYAFVYLICIYFFSLNKFEKEKIKKVVYKKLRFNK